VVVLRICMRVCVCMCLCKCGRRFLTYPFGLKLGQQPCGLYYLVCTPPWPSLHRPSLRCSDGADHMCAGIGAGGV
jgi:hypothetical protein